LENNFRLGFMSAEAGRDGQTAESRRNEGLDDLRRQAAHLFAFLSRRSNRIPQRPDRA
jgi:hypothetical protein